MHQQISVQLGGLPLNITFISNGQLGLTPRGAFNLIVDNTENGLSAIISSENMLVDNEEIEYNVALSKAEHPKLWQWLSEQQLIYPQF